MSNNLPKWTEDRTQTLESMVSGESVITRETVEQAAQSLETSVKSVAAKLRKLGYEVASLAKSTTSSFTPEEQEELRSFLEANPNVYTFGEIAEQLFSGEKSPKQIQGKILSMEMTSAVKPTPKPETVKKYTDEEELQIVTMLRQNAYIEDIAQAVNRPVNSVRGKVLATLNKLDEDLPFPQQRNKVERSKVDPFESLENIAEMTVEEIAEQLEKTVRGVKAMLTHRGITCANYDGAKRAAKNAEKRAAEQAA